MVRYLRAANVKDGRLLLDDVKEMNFDPAEQAVFSLARGDVLITEGAGSLAAVGASAVWDGSLEGPLCFQNTLVRMRPKAGTSDRYLGWLARFAYGSGLFASIAGGANIYHLGAEAVRVLTVPAPASDEQRRIADFLDAETVRIDALVAAKERMVTVASERLGAVRDSVLWRGHRLTNLRHLVDPDRPVTYGIVLPGPNVEGPGTVAIVKGGDVARRFSRPLNRTTAEIELPYRRSRLVASDLVMSIRGGIGDVAEVPEWADGANLTQDAARIAPAGGVSGRWLLHVLASPTFQRSVEMMRTGSTVTGLNIGDIRRMNVPSVPRVSMDQAAALLDAEVAHHDRLASTLTTQIGLLRERRQALITAAVTGEIEV